jgi:hypothetical protein
MNWADSHQQSSCWEGLILFLVPSSGILMRVEALNDTKNRNQAPAGFAITRILSLNRQVCDSIADLPVRREFPGSANCSDRWKSGFKVRLSTTRPVNER